MLHFLEERDGAPQHAKEMVKDAGTIITESRVHVLICDPLAYAPDVGGSFLEDAHKASYLT